MSSARAVSGDETGRAESLPFFVYGTLRPGEHNHDRFLRGRTAREEPARLDGALLYDGPGYPYAVEAVGAGDPRGAVVGELVTPTPGHYGELLRLLDELEGFTALPGDSSNLYERAARDVRPLDGTGSGTSTGAPVRAWVYFAAPRVARDLRARGRLIPGGDWTARTGPH
ncbi:gamma-glutamylcyclotransferase family protein [Streptomyces sp. NPDC088725]|uniref:gamma-glutamylcyclotransferase family protein n=1 Tax=Streptomyces sp. NPDC088725 TaxID=3365873 RepID=UPI00380B611A